MNKRREGRGTHIIDVAILVL